MPEKKSKKQIRKLEALYERMNAEILPKLSAIETHPSRFTEFEKQLKEFAAKQTLEVHITTLKTPLQTPLMRIDLPEQCIRLHFGSVPYVDAEGELWRSCEAKSGKQKQEGLSVATTAVLQGLGIPHTPTDTAALTTGEGKAEQVEPQETPATGDTEANKAPPTKEKIRAYLAQLETAAVVTNAEGKTEQAAENQKQPQEQLANFEELFEYSRGLEERRKGFLKDLKVKKLLLNTYSKPPERLVTEISQIQRCLEIENGFRDQCLAFVLHHMGRDDWPRLTSAL